MIMLSALATRNLGTVLRNGGVREGARVFLVHDNTTGQVLATVPEVDLNLRCIDPIWERIDG